MVENLLVLPRTIKPPPSPKCLLSKRGRFMSKRIYRDKDTVVNYAYRDPYGGNNLFPRGVLQR